MTARTADRLKWIGCSTDHSHVPKLLQLRRADVCAMCQSELQARTRAWWDATTKSVTCTTCQPTAADESQRATIRKERRTPIAGSPPSAIDHGIGGASAQAKYDHLRSRHDHKIEARWGTGVIGSVAKVLATEPQSTTAWAKGAAGERALARRLEADLAPPIVTLHDRRVPGTKGNIDHLIISPAGIWIVDAKNYEGKVERRDVGGWRTTDIQLFVNGRNRTKSVIGMEWQVAAVRTALHGTAFSEIPIHPALCFTNSEWPLFAKPGVVKGVWILWAKKLVEMARESGALDERAIGEVALQLSDRLPATISRPIDSPTHQPSGNAR